MAEPIKMPFGLTTRVGPENHVLDGGPDPTMGRGNFEGKGGAIVKYRATLRSSVQNGWTDLGAVSRLGFQLGWAQEIMWIMC